jgi:murein DD-endopeptidase MepM/ murein hydrolase activator NlpD
MHRFIALLFFQIITSQIFGQNNYSFHPPVDIPMILSGNFGELRADHFHSGIDIKTRGTIGHPVFSMEEGYVSRIKVQANGYGKSIYIDHPNGYTSVYGHLDRYREDIAAYVNEMQYKYRSHALDLYLKPGQFPIEKGALIAYSGNTGGSSGPHLHFEIRTSGNQHPTNVLQYGFPIEDNLAPRFISLSLVPGDNSSHVNGTAEKLSVRTVRDNGIYTIPYGTVVRASGKVGISVEVFDYLNGASNRCGVYTLDLYVDGQKLYSHSMDEFSFSETRYVNAHIDYEELIRSGTKAHRLYRLPNDRLRIYKELTEDGWIQIDKERNYQLRIVASDVGGNTATLEFQIRGDTVSSIQDKSGHLRGKLMPYQQLNRFETDEVSVEIPANALYQDLLFTYVQLPADTQFQSGLHQIHDSGTPLHLPYSLAIKTTMTDPALRGKLLLVTYNEEHELEPAGGEFINGTVMASVTNFGMYAVALDTVSPEIIPDPATAKKDLSGAKIMKFLIRDTLSGIDQYNGYIDNQWALFEYDPKNDLLTYTFDKKRLDAGSEHELELYVSDEKGNVNLYHTTFTW